MKFLKSYEYAGDYTIEKTATHMLERGQGQIINVSSVTGQKVFPSAAVYSGTKFAVKAISEGLRQETAGKIQVTTIYPGAFTTELGDSVKDESIRAQLGQWADISGNAEEVAKAIMFAISQDPAVAINDLTIRPIKQDV